MLIYHSLPVAYAAIFDETPPAPRSALVVPLAAKDKRIVRSFDESTRNQHYIPSLQRFPDHKFGHLTTICVCVNALPNAGLAAMVKCQGLVTASCWNVECEFSNKALKK